MNRKFHLYCYFNILVTLHNYGTVIEPTFKLNHCDMLANFSNTFQVSNSKKGNSYIAELAGPLSHHELKM